MYCEKCGNRLSDDDIFCSSCGASVKRPASHGSGQKAASAIKKGGDGGKKRAKRKIWLWIIPVFVLFFVLLLAGAGLFFGYRGNRPEDVVVNFSEKGNPMVLLCDTSDILVGETVDIRLTVLNPSGEQVEITDNNGTALLTLTQADSDKEGGWSKTVSLTASSPSVIELTAKCGDEISESITVFAAPEITFEMVEECSSVGADLRKYLKEKGYDYGSYDEEALRAAEEWLKQDERVQAVKRISSMTLFLTRGNVVGGCPIKKEKGTFGYREFTEDGEGVDLYTKWEEENSLSNAYIYGNHTLTNDRILVLRPIYSYDYNCGKTDYYIDMAGKLSNAAKAVGSVDISDDLYAVTDLANGKLNEYGAVFFNTHGGVGNYQDSEGTDRKIWTFVMCTNLGGADGVFEVLTEAELKRTGLTDDYQMFYGDTSWFTSGNMENIRLILDGLSIHGTSNYLMSQYQGKMFDNTFLYFGICDSACDNRLNQFFVNHGAAAYAGYKYSIQTDVEKDTLKQYVKYLSKMKKKEQRLENVSEAVNEFFGIGKTIYRGVSSVAYNLLGWAEDQDCYNFFGQAGFTFYGCGELSGKVVTEDKEDDPEGANVTLYRYLNQDFKWKGECEVEKDGEFIFEDIPWGIYVATVEKKGFERAVAWTQLDETEKDCGEIILKRGDIYYTFIKEELEPELGLLELGERTQTIGGFEEYGWDSRYGIFSAKVADLDGDKTDDLALVTVEASDNGNGLKNSKIKLSVYTLENGEVVLKDSQIICSLNHSEYQRGDLLLWTKEGTGEKGIFYESHSKGILVDYNSPFYAMYRYKNGRLYREFTLGQTRGGTSQIGYGLIKNDPETGEEEEELVWTDSSYPLYSGGEQGTYNQYSWDSLDQMFEAVLRDQGLPESQSQFESGIPSWADRTDCERFFTLFTDGRWSGNFTDHAYSFTNTYQDFSQLRERLKELEEK